MNEGAQLPPDDPGPEALQHNQTAATDSHEPVPVFAPPQDTIPSQLREDSPAQPPEMPPSSATQDLPAPEPFIARHEPVPPSAPVYPPGPSRPDADSLESAYTPFLANYPFHSIAAPARIPNFGHLLIFLLLALGGYLCSGMAIFSAMHFHLFGVSDVKQAANEIHYTLGSQAIWYFATFAGCLLSFPFVWHRGFFDGLGWNAASAIRLRIRLIGAAVVCFVLAIIDGIFIPGPQDTPIDQIFRMPGAAWLLFAFGITLAPFFEETAFRGFLLPALCTAYDWAQERVTHTPAPPLDETSHPRWSLPAMAVGSLLTSIPFALMHGEQTGYSLGPFLLLVCVSLVLCWVRLATRSLASSVLVHSCYNLLLFSLMLAGTHGFKHLDKL